MTKLKKFPWPVWVAIGVIALSFGAMFLPRWPQIIFRLGLVVVAIPFFTWWIGYNRGFVAGLRAAHQLWVENIAARVRKETPPDTHDAADWWKEPR